jgi:1,2-diacylglycerol 3-alpha-glucosyltransferase
MEKTSTEFSSPKNVSSLRIGLFTDTYAPQVNGVSISIQLVSKGLRAKGHQVTIFAPNFPGYHDEQSGVYRVPSLKYLNKPPLYVAVLGTPRITWSLSRRQFDVLHAHSPVSIGLLAYLTASSKKLPLIYTYHFSMSDYTHYVKIVGGTGVIRRAVRWFSATTTNLGDQIVVPSAKFKWILLEQNVRKPIHVVPNGIDLSAFQKAKAPGSFRAQLGVKADAPILLSVGRIDPEKRLDFLVDVFARLADQFPEARLVFAGDGAARKDLEEKAKSTKASERIRFLGMVNRADLPDILHDATVFLSASTSETQGISMLEAIAAGLPVVAVQDDAFEGMLVDGANGYQVPLDVEAFVKTLSELLSDRAKLERFGKKSMELSAKFSIEKQVQDLESLYIEAILQNWRGKHVW